MLAHYSILRFPHNTPHFIPDRNQYPDWQEPLQMSHYSLVMIDIETNTADDDCNNCIALQVSDRWEALHTSIIMYIVKKSPWFYRSHGH
jgi:hypothetical protein